MFPLLLKEKGSGDELKNTIKQAARNLRKNNTNAEKIFWQIVRNRRIKNRKFYRQYPINFECDEQKRFFIADFYCHECKLVVEIDGNIHEKQKDYDKFRSFIINQLGIKVIRFKNEEIENSLDDVIAKLTLTLS